MFNNVKLGIAPIGWTNDDMPQLGGELTFEQMVSEAALAGFQGTEVGGKFPTDPAVLNKALDLRGIKIASQWFSSFLCSTPYEENEKAFIEQLDFLPREGESVTLEDGMRLVVEALDKNRIELVHIWLPERKKTDENQED